MAKTRALAHRPAPVLHFPSRGKFRRAGGAIARRAGHVAAKSLPTTGVALGAAAVGYATGKGYLDRLPAIGGSRVFTLGLIGFAATRFVKNPHVRNAGLAALAAAAFDFGRAQATGVSGIDDGTGDTKGEDQF